VSKFALAAEEATRKAAAKRAEANALADKEGGLSKEEAARFDGLVQDAEALDLEAHEHLVRAERQRQNGEALADYARPRARQAADPKGEPVVVRESWQDDPQCGFKTQRHFLLSVLEAPKARRLDSRLRFLAAAGSDEQGEYSDPHGNFLVPVGFSPTLMKTPTEADPIAGRTTSLPMTSPVVEWPARVDKDHRTTVSGGLVVTRKAETVAAAASRQKYEKIRMAVDDLFGVAIATERILADSPISFAALLEAGFAEEFAAKALEERLYGSGVGEYLGILNSPCLVSIPRAGAGAIAGADILTARRRCWRYGDAIWLANHDTYEDLAAAHISGTNGDVFLFNPARGEDVPDMLLGRPVFFTEFAETKGSKGDLILGNWSQYLEGVYQSEQRAESIHVRFLDHERVFKFWIRNAGAPWWSAALTPKKGADTLSPFVVIAA
jgi:HK97 family phage major capsid protein